MKKRIAIVLAVLSIFTVLASCNRRDQYRDPVGTDPNAETTSPTTNAVTDQPDNPDETTGQETESGTTPVNPGNLPSPEKTGNPYAGMSAEDLLVHYTETPKYVSQSGDIVVNTPYYYILCNGENGTGGKAYSKLTGNMVTLCKELGCKHQNCMFDAYVMDCVVAGDRIYMTLVNSNSKVEKCFLYSFNLMLDDANLLYEWSDIDTPQNMSEYNGKLYMTGNILCSDGEVRKTLFAIDPQAKAYDFALGEEFIIQHGSFICEGSYYYTALDGTLWRVDLTTKEHTCLLDASYLDFENGDIRFIVECFVNDSLIGVARQNVTRNKTWYYDVNTGDFFSQEEVFRDPEKWAMWNQQGQYAFLNHTASAYENDPHFTYYNDKAENWLANYTGGEIWFRETEDDEMTLVARMMTDDIPDMIVSVAATDGKTLIVMYKTYKDFDNIYNNYSKETRGDNPSRYAIIDLETGIVYKNNYVESA